MQWATAQDINEWIRAMPRHTSQQAASHSPNRFQFESTSWCI